MPARRFVVIGVLVVLGLGAVGVWWLRKPIERPTEAVVDSADEIDKPIPSEPVVAPSQDQPRLIAQLGHSGNVTSLVLSPDGKRLFTGSYDLTARLWDVETGKELCRFIGHHQVSAVAFSFDGKRVLTGGNDPTARLWDAETGKELIRFEHKVDVDVSPVSGFSVYSVAFVPDRKRVLTATRDGVHLWDVETGKELRRFQSHADGVTSIAFAPDGTRVLTGSWDKTACLWDVDTGKELRRFQNHAERITAVAFAPDGTRVLTGSWDKTARLWDVETGKELRRFQNHAEGITGVAFAPDGTRIFTGSFDKTACLWDVETGKELRRFQGHTEPITGVAFAPDGKRVFTGSADKSVRHWDIETGAELRRFEGHASNVRSVALSPDGKWVLVGSGDISARLWDLKTGKGPVRFQLHSGAGGHVAFASHSKRAVTGGTDKTARLWDIDTGRELLSFRGHADRITAVAIAPDCKKLLTGSSDNTARLWDVETGKELCRLQGHAQPITGVAFAPDGKRVLTSSLESAARLWEAETGKQLLRFEGHSFTDGIPFPFAPDVKWVVDESGDKSAFMLDHKAGREFTRFERHASVLCVAVAPCGRRVLTGSNDKTARLWDVETGNELRRFRGHSGSVESAVFSQDGKWVLTGGGDGTARLWDTGTGQELCGFHGHSGPVSSTAISIDGKWVLTGGFDSTARLWNVETARQLCSLISFRDGTWAVVDPDGRFDAANGGDVQDLHWVVGNEPIDLAQLKERYYDPGLLAKKMGFNKEPLRQVEALTNPKLFPSLKLTEPTADNPKLGVTLSNRGGGIGRVVVKVNGKELTADARAAGHDPNAQTMQVHVDLANDPRLKPGEANKIEVQAFNAEGYLRSRGLDFEYTPPGQTSRDAINLWAIVAGVSKYRGEVINLRYAAKDAEDFATALNVAATRLFTPTGGKVNLTLLTTSQTDPAKQPTRENLVRALDAAKQSKPGDIFVVYLAGHGVSHGGQDSDFYFLTGDAQSANLTDPAVRDQVALSADKLTELIKQVPALKQVLFLDTCAAGTAVQRLTEKRDVPSSQIRALERVKDRTGLHILAGCAENAVSYEATRYGQGILTYTLLMGMRGAKLREGQYVDVADLFGFAADEVPKLAKDIGGIQRPIIASPRGGSFDIGQVMAEDKEKIPLQPVRPLMLQSEFQEEESFSDVLKLRPAVDELLRDTSTRGRSAPLVFVDARDMPSAHRLAGRYAIKDGQVNVRVNLFQGDEKKHNFDVTGSRTDVGKLAAEIVRETEKRLDSNTP